ncbi:unnamed protein product [Taenia asiatica]|uniref:Hexosyltransferase n=1 Tax=Taenia asiatica TaxID=60517 RepID=A0A0R3VXK0_TAEAS|nr:unnamed protein product [Taenia asiatica]
MASPFYRSLTCCIYFTLPPIYNPQVRFLRVPSKVCSPLTPAQAKFGLTDYSSRPNVVIIYKSGVYNFEERSHLRKLYHLAYTDVKIHLIFSIGLPRSVLDNVFQRDGFNVTLANRAGNKLVEYSRMPQRTNRLLSKEMEEYDDLLVGDYEDSYYNLTLKLFHTFQWAARFCRPYKPTFVFLGDDHAVNTNKLVNFVRDLTPKSGENLNYGFEMMLNPVVRFPSKHERWALSKREALWPMHMPHYSGVYSLWSYRHVHDIALGMHFTKPMVTDDVWSGIVQHKLNLKFTRLKGMFSHYMTVPKSVSCSEIFFAHLKEFERHQCVL